MGLLNLNSSAVIRTRNQSAEEYGNYIKTHIQMVNRAFDEYGKDLCHELGVSHNVVQNIIDKHDLSKFGSDEFTGYRTKFYPVEGEVIPEEDFDLAWLHHIRNNKYHPEYWIIPDAKGNKILEMPREYIVEMICDWQSFSYIGKVGAYTFYHTIDNKEGLLHPNTRILVEKGLDVINAREEGNLE